MLMPDVCTTSWRAGFLAAAISIGLLLLAVVLYAWLLHRELRRIRPRQVKLTLWG